MHPPRRSPLIALLLATCGDAGDAGDAGDTAATTSVATSNASGTTGELPTTSDASAAESSGTTCEPSEVAGLELRPRPPGPRPGAALGLMWSGFDPTSSTLRIERSLKRERGQLRLGPTKTRKSRRAIALPAAAVASLAKHRRRQASERLRAGSEWNDLGFIFPTTVGTLLDPSNFRREFNRVCKEAGLGHWHPHELRHSAVSLLSAAGVSIELVAAVMGHSTTRTTEAVYRH